MILDVWVSKHGGTFIRDTLTFDEAVLTVVIDDDEVCLKLVTGFGSLLLTDGGVVVLETGGTVLGPALRAWPVVLWNTINPLVVILIVLGFYIPSTAASA